MRLSLTPSGPTGDAMPTLKNLRRTVWVFVGIAVLCVSWCVIEPPSKRIWVRFGPARHEALPIQSVIGIASALLAGGAALVAVAASVLAPREQPGPEGPPHPDGNVSNPAP